MSGLKWVTLAAGALVLAAMGAAAFGASRWAGITKTLLARLAVARQPQTLARYDASEIEGLPAPVQRYFRSVLTDGQPIVTAVWLEQAGSMNMSETASQWKPFTARQRVVTRRPGFDWDARILMLPGVRVHVHDAYIAGVGMLRAALFGLVPVANVGGTPEMAQGELMRYFAEAVWYPTALLPGQGVRWDAIDDRSARATLTDGETTIALTFFFQDDGPIDRFHAEARGRLVGGKLSTAAWQGRFWSYALQDGMRVPLEGEVAWVLPEGARVYWRGKVTALSHEFVVSVND